MTVQTLPEILLVDARVDAIETLAADVAGRARLRVIDAGEDAIAVLTGLLAEGPVAALHVVAHGAPGRLMLGRGMVDATALLERSALTAGWSAALAGSDILLYACEAGRGAEGARLVEVLAGLTGARVAAAPSLVGATASGPDWTLDVTTGAAEAGAMLFSPSCARAMPVC